jgi:streptogramin lyase
LKLIFHFCALPPGFGLTVDFWTDAGSFCSIPFRSEFRSDLCGARREKMMRTGFLFSSLTCGLVLLLQAAPGSASPNAASRVALTGQVTSREEGKMEGVVVSAKKAGSIVTVSVVSDSDGRYSFPADRLEPGHYAVAIRAVGYNLDSPTETDIAPEKTTTDDLRLRRTENLASQLTNAEWLLSMPGTDDQKAMVLNCSDCHTFERIMRSTHNADEWVQVIYRMKGYAAVTQPIKPQIMNDPTRAGTPEQYRELANYLATVNLSGTPEWTYPLKTMPRPTGRATRVIVTEYDLPRPTIQPHDVLLDADGMVWYSDFGELFIAKFDPKTLKLTEYPLKQFKPGFPEGSLALEPDPRDGTLWFDMMFQAAIGNLDPKTGQIKYYPLSPDYNDVGVQLDMLGLHHEVDGKVWSKNSGNRNVYRVELATGKWERFEPIKALPGGQAIYQVLSDSRNNAWMSDYIESHIGKIDASTGQVTWFNMPTPHARVRRMWMDPEDRLWFAEYRANKLGMFDTRTEKSTEWPLPTKWTNPYRVTPDRNGELWTGGMTTDRVTRFDPETGHAVEYLMPADTNIRDTFVDNRTTPVTFWTGSNHGAALVKVEPLD